MVMALDVGMATVEQVRRGYYRSVLIGAVPQPHRGIPFSAHSLLVSI